MRRALRLLAWLVVGVVLVGGVGAYGLWAGWHVPDVPPADISALLRPHDLVFQPEGEGPFPTAILFHGCGGLRGHNTAWGRFLAENGWAAVVVDSYTGRGLAWQTVCSGRALLGPERAGDVLVSVADVRGLPFVDPERIALLGWSHGSWAIMDLLAMAPPQSRPTGLSELPTAGLDGVIGAVLFYPYCGLVSRSPGSWSSPASTLLLLAENDTITSTPECLAVADQLQQRGLRVSTHVHPGVDHGFDAFDDRGDYPSTFDPAASDDAHRRVLRFLGGLP